MKLLRKNFICPAIGLTLLASQAACTPAQKNDGIQYRPAPPVSAGCTGNRAAKGAIRDGANILLRSFGKSAREQLGRDWGRTVERAARRQVQDAMQCRR